MATQFEVNFLEGSGVRFIHFKSGELPPPDYIGMSSIEKFGKSYKFRISFNVNYRRKEDTIFIKSEAYIFLQSDIVLFEPHAKEPSICAIADCLYLMSEMIFETSRKEVPGVRKRIFQTNVEAIPHARGLYESSARNN